MKTTRIRPAPRLNSRGEIPSSHRQPAALWALLLAFCIFCLDQVRLHALDLGVLLADLVFVHGDLIVKVS